MGLKSIAQCLDSLGFKPPYAIHWGALTVRYILKNERYVGDLLLQKTFIQDHLTKSKRINRGELPRYYVTGAYPPIISRGVFELSQRIAAVNTEKFTPVKERAHELLSGLIICTKCQKPYKRKVAHGRAAWNCSTFMRQGKSYCHGKQVPEDTLLESTSKILAGRPFDSIQRILVPAPNHLIYVFKDGTETECTWQDRSRSSGPAPGNYTKRRVSPDGTIEAKERGA